MGPCTVESPYTGPLYTGFRLYPVSGYTGQISSAQTVKVPYKRYSMYRFHAVPVDFRCVFGDRYREVSL